MTTSMEEKNIYKCDLRFNLKSRELIDLNDIEDLMKDYGFKNINCVEEDKYSIVMNALSSEELIKRFEENQDEIVNYLYGVEYIEVFKRKTEAIPYYPYLKSYFNEGAWKSYMDVLAIEMF